jgi:CubicO group peptidase (beta-lactamase class C family)
LTDEQKDRITLKHLLIMTSGLRWNELEVWLGYMRHDVVQLFLVPDPLRYILARPVDMEPGTAWYYNGGGVCVLGNYATHEPVYEILTRYILPAVQ